MTDLTAKLREALPCECSQPENCPQLGEHFNHCPAKFRAKVEAVVREMVAKVPHLRIVPVGQGEAVIAITSSSHVAHMEDRCTSYGGQCAFGGEKGTNNG